MSYMDEELKNFSIPPKSLENQDTICGDGKVLISFTEWKDNLSNSLHCILYLSYNKANFSSLFSVTLPAAMDLGEGYNSLGIHYSYICMKWLKNNKKHILLTFSSLLPCASNFFSFSSSFIFSEQFKMSFLESSVISISEVRVIEAEPSICITIRYAKKWMRSRNSASKGLNFLVN